MARKVRGTGPIQYRIFVQDVGAYGFSGVVDAMGHSPGDAIDQSETASPPAEKRQWFGRKLIALPYTRMDLWPDGKTGAVPTEALKFR